MPILHVRNVPEALYSRIQQRACAQKRSISAEVIRLLERALEEPERPALEVLDDIRRRRFRPSAEVPNSLTMLREDRAR